MFPKPPLKLVYFVAGAALCAAISYGAWRVMGASGLVLTSPAWGALLALPLLDGAAALGRFARWLRWFDVAGRYFEHRGRWVDVVEDDERRRYVRLEHVRQHLPGLPHDASLAHRYPALTLARGGQAYLRDDALLDYLGKGQSEEATRLRIWLDREVVQPGRNRRERRR